MAKPRKTLQKDLDIINTQFKSIDQSLEAIINSISETMPLAAKSLELSREIMKQYKLVYNNEWKDIQKQ
jgi:hypothetical protein